MWSSAPTSYCRPDNRSHRKWVVERQWRLMSLQREFPVEGQKKSSYVFCCPDTRLRGLAPRPAPTQVRQLKKRAKLLSCRRPDAVKTGCGSRLGASSKKVS